MPRTFTDEEMELARAGIGALLQAEWDGVFDHEGSVEADFLKSVDLWPWPDRVDPPADDEAALAARVSRDLRAGDRRGATRG